MWQRFIRFLGDPWYLGLLWRTVQLSIVVTVISIIVGYPLAYWIWRSSGVRKALLMSAVLIPLFTNLIARLYGWQIILSKSGPLNYLLVELGLLDDNPITINKAEISPRSFLAKCLPPKLQYKNDEKDVALLRVEAWGLKDNKKVKVIYDLIDYRDLETGLFAMNRTVGFSASIGALMILSGSITQSGVLSPVRHVPPHEFIKEVEARGMRVDHKILEMD